MNVRRRFAAVLLALALLCTFTLSSPPVARAVKDGETFHSVYSGQDRTEMYLVDGA